MVLQVLDNAATSKPSMEREIMSQTSLGSLVATQAPSALKSILRDMGLIWKRKGISVMVTKVPLVSNETLTIPGYLTR
jgi:hypothetical protein